MILTQYPDLKYFLKPNDQYPELQNILENKTVNLPAGSLNTRVIVNNGKIIEKVYKTPKGQVFSLVMKSSNIVYDQIA